MTLATISSIIESKGIDPNNIAEKFINWFKNGEETIKKEWKDDLSKLDYIKNLCESFDKVLSS